MGQDPASVGFSHQEVLPEGTSTPTQEAAFSSYDFLKFGLVFSVISSTKWRNLISLNSGNTIMGDSDDEESDFEGFSLEQLTNRTLIWIWL